MEETLAISGQVMNDFNFDQVMEEILKSNGDEVKEAGKKAREKVEVMDEVMDEVMHEVMDEENEEAEETIVNVKEKTERESFLKAFFQLIPTEILEKGATVTRNIEDQFEKRKIELRSNAWFSLF